ncbi:MULTISPECIES: fructose-1,6-bisphosphate aldolase/phosphatase [Dehalococcoides]|jgi:fructose 1,6-bisphosphate aldolase/phosphatase|uniref:Fructose-1,6-bisphosphate aldolase/phosphatase n=2 Tax=Dehalococcoides mccartyi TaxID=61435 RepID=A0A142VC17_9CHLR|nr:MULTISPECIES: fructose-1,6-bisphosphate aldolase/phosphatase [Dehalococcoides]AGG06687.1 fructose-1,6-bisphosphatase, type V, archaeal [Dehalococcoides mccartyi DCMB5]AGG08180.1 fructose-1,6-bisphosphatase, type V, archaeal [Dehalococcoides mccartyi BTF08]AMU86877.1 fructose 1,6-bisphosphate aldolase/phosphatase [Dehalococcoides mccartyi]AOV99665.1 fructose-1,6-bisphosphatase, type V [Dehalococcoides mccartyi]AQU06222.1 fructose 1,6-bisphosphatase [Dehalococcoides mccartyi]
MKVTLSVIKADIGGFVGHSDSHPQCLARAEKHLAEAKKKGMLIDYHITKCGDDLQLIMTHQKGINNKVIHEMAWDTFVSCTEVAKELKLYGAGQDLLCDAFSGNVKGMGPGVAEMEIDERPSEPIIIFMADKTSSGAWNLPLYKMFADPFNTIGLVIAENMHDGFSFEVHDVKESKGITFNTPEEIYDLLVFIGAPSRFAIKSVSTRKGEIAAVSSTQKLALLAGRYVGKDDPVCIVRAQGAFPAVGEILEPFTQPYLVEGWMRGSHNGPIMPVSVEDSTPTRFDGPPRVTALGFQLSNGMLIGPRDMFKDKSFDNARQKSLDMADMMRSHGPFEPHRLPLEEMEYTTMPQVSKKLAGRFKPLKD